MDRRDYLVINARDVTDSERARLEREAILQNASIGIAMTRDRRFVLANPRFEQMFGWPAGALVGQPRRGGLAQRRRLLRGRRDCSGPRWRAASRSSSNA